MRDKVSLLDHLGVPGPWNHWADVPWLPQVARRSSERHCYKMASTSVLRLSSGLDPQYLSRSTAQQERYLLRLQAIFRTLAMVDQHVEAGDRAAGRVLMGLENENLAQVSWL